MPSPYPLPSRLPPGSKLSGWLAGRNGWSDAGSPICVLVSRWTSSFSSDAMAIFMVSEFVSSFDSLCLLLLLTLAWPGCQLDFCKYFWKPLFLPSRRRKTCQHSISEGPSAWPLSNWPPHCGARTSTAQRRDGLTWFAHSSMELALLTEALFCLERESAPTQSQVLVLSHSRDLWTEFHPLQWIRARCSGWAHFFGPILPSGILASQATCR